MGRRKLLIPGILLLLGACGLGDPGGEIPTFTVSRGEFMVRVVESGELAARQSTVISVPRIRGGALQIVKMASEGTQVAEGDFLVQFDGSELDKEVSTKNADLEIDQAELRKLKLDQGSRISELENQLANQEAGLELEELRRDRMRFEAEAQQREAELQLTKARLALEQAREKLATQRVIHQEELRKLELKIEQARSRLARARGDLEKLTMLAPGPGLVVHAQNWQTDDKMKVGDSPWPGWPVIELPDLSQMTARAQVGELDISKVAVEQEAVVTLDAFPDRSFEGRVTSIATLATEKARGSAVKVFPVEALLDGTDPIMKPGMTVRLEIVIERVSEVLSVPLEAIFESDGHTVCHVRRGGAFRERNVELGQRNADFVVVVDGLEEGDRVALRDPNLALESIGLPEERKGEGPEVPRS